MNSHTFIDPHRWQAGKEEHIRLSNAAAESYDEKYAQANYATKLYMDYEIAQIARVIGLSPGSRTALDLGCGTGRDSFVLAEHVEQVYGYDNAPDMIRQADRSKLGRRIGNVAFQVLDVEETTLPHRANSIDIVNSGFGMASFLREPATLLAEVRRVLKPGGYALFSFYNRSSLIKELPVGWAPSLAALAGDDYQSLNVSLNAKECFSLSARFYTVNEVRAELARFLEVIDLVTFPSLSGLLPQEVFENCRMQELCKLADEHLASNLGIAAGHYIVAICRKQDDSPVLARRSGYQRALELLQAEGLEGDIIRHAPLKTMKDVEIALAPYGVERKEMLKSVLLSSEHLEAPGRAETAFWLAVLPANRKLHRGKLARALGQNRQELELATTRVLEAETGFLQGGVPPFGMPSHIPVVFDSRISDLEHAWCGTGDPCQSINLSMSALERLAMPTYADISKSI